jgi:thiamine biosynthesis lipoprotein
MTASELETMNAKYVLIRCLVLSCLAACMVGGVAGCSILMLLNCEPGVGAGPVTRIERTRLCMGVPARITVDFDAYADQQPIEDAIDRAFAVLAALDSELSDYMIDSEVNRVNAAAGGAPVAIEEPLASVLTIATEVSRASDGAFDATVGPASLAWRRAKKSGELPSEEELARVRPLVNWRALDLDPARGTARLPVPGMRLDLGGIGKGFAAQRALDRLRADGFPRAMVALAGDIAVGEAPSRGRLWRIEISPSDDRAVGNTVALENQAVSTSGDTQQFVEINGRRFSHIVDPRTGLGTPGGVTVSVVAPRGDWADALATAAVNMLSRGEPDASVAAMLRVCPGSRAIVQRRTPDGRPERTTIDAPAP